MRHPYAYGSAGASPSNCGSPLPLDTGNWKATRLGAARAIESAYGAVEKAVRLLGCETVGLMESGLALLLLGEGGGALPQKVNGLWGRRMSWGHGVIGPVVKPSCVRNFLTYHKFLY